MREPVRVSSEHESIFASAVDKWLAALLLSIPLIAAGVTVTLAIEQPEELWVMAIVWLVVIGFGYALIWPVNYTVTPEHLRVRAGKYTTRIPLESISSVTPSTNPLSSPALSLKRLKVDHGDGKWVLVSPRDRAGFLDALEKGTGLARRGETLGSVAP